MRASCLVALSGVGLLLSGPPSRTHRPALEGESAPPPFAHGAHDGHGHDGHAQDGHAREEHAHGGHAHGDDAGPVDFAALVEKAADPAALAELFDRAPDEGARSDVVVRALAADLKTGVRLSIGFLRRAPPLYFALAVVEELDRATGKPSGFDVEAPFDSDANRGAAARLVAEYGLEKP